MNPLPAPWWLSAVALACYAAAAGAHLALVRRRRGTARDAVSVQAGLLIALLAIISPLGYWSGIYLWVRAIQDLTLSFIVPALIVLGRPWLVLRQPPQGGPDRGGGAGGVCAAGGARAAGDGAAAPPRDDLPEVETAWSRAGPVLAVAVFNLAWIGWHLPAAFDLVPGQPAVRLAEQACYLGAGVWFWLQLAGPRPPGRWRPPLRRLALLTATVATGTVLGMVLVFGSSVIYPAYANSAHHVMTVLDDQQLSGAVLWMGMLPPLIIAAVALLMTWLNDEESDSEPDLDRLLSRRTSGWAARSGLR
jgi:cytochrome c oxidase assembly factor CtaG